MSDNTNKPVHEYRLGRIVGAVWFNEDAEGGGWHSVKISRLYKDGESWKRTTSFNRNDLPLVCKVADQLHTWILQTFQDTDQPAGGETQAAQVSAAA